ncbi:hypothetical protein FIBSPDRAFT_959370 [Athelia psychrophila]|uniref:FAD-dependent oxidoreductase 2 FAD-binding domain-containing protein n=1 Tax=Athelia psychrophila TaxID=1759441 RepID=A0A166DJA7_9AGAM|nr:hypothetical protein FIBSPDRAFT_959370 [Fibularhizoctonia sp. CBS 109695]
MPLLPRLDPYHEPSQTPPALDPRTRARRPLNGRSDNAVNWRQDVLPLDLSKVAHLSGHSSPGPTAATLNPRAWSSHAKKGTTTEVAYGPVVLATGGYAADITLAMLAGASAINMEKVQVHPMGLGNPKERDPKVKFFAVEALCGVGGLLLYNTGTWFVDEVEQRDHVTEKMWENSKYPIRLILNGAASEEIEWHRNHHRRARQGHGLDPQVLAETCSKYNDGVGTKTNPFGKKFFAEGEWSMNDFFNVADMIPVLHYTVGGLEINAESWFAWTLSLVNVPSTPSNPAGEFSFGQNHFDGTIALTSLVGLGIFAALDILTIRRTVNQCTFLIIETIIVILMPLSMWPIIVSSINLFESNWLDSFVTRSCFDPSSGNRISASFFCAVIMSIWWLPASGDEVTSALVIAATVAILALSTAFLSYICIAAITDKVRGINFLPIYPGDPSSSTPKVLRNCYFLGNPRTPTEREAMTSHCTDYIFRNSVFRKHAFEPTIWAIFRGIVAIYACASLVAFSAYSALSEAQLRETLVVTESIQVSEPSPPRGQNLYVTSFLMPPNDPVAPINPEQNPQFLFSGVSIEWQSPAPGVWTCDFDPWLNFNISWIGESSLVTWVTSNGTVPGFMNSTQVLSTNPLILAPFAQYKISLIAIHYILLNSEFILWTPGTRAVSPFGLLGIVTHGRFKRLIHEQYPRMQEDIEHGGMAAYISEVAIDAALMDIPPAKGGTDAASIENEAGGGDAMELRRRQNGSSRSDLESHPLLRRETNQG